MLGAVARPARRDDGDADPRRGRNRRERGARRTPMPSSTSGWPTQPRRTASTASCGHWRRRVPGTTLTVSGGPNRPPLPTTASAALFALAREAADGLGLPGLTGVVVGGGSDGNFTAAVGCPTLDGLGAVGDGAHAEGEHVLHRRDGGARGAACRDHRPVAADDLGQRRPRAASTARAVAASRAADLPPTDPGR